ncbi:hypothetical protein CCR75_001312 [Bremia lactucae]|uniref:Uncharacterized protein n=1 Tax=Bremia lactucae TaxID=4779 RepID=A0A976FEP2_BRELC|nr:hypothetical protein CCR75_001312 [Bremia lactucae]
MLDCPATTQQLQHSALASAERPFEPYGTLCCLLEQVAQLIKTPFNAINRPNKAAIDIQRSK